MSLFTSRNKIWRTIHTDHSNKSYNASNTVRTSVLLITGSNTSSVSKEIANKLMVKSEMCNIIVLNVMSIENKLPSQLVNFAVSLNSHPGRIDIRNLWVFKDSTIQTKKIDIKNLVIKYI